MTRSPQTISFWVIYVWLCRDSTDFFTAYLSARAIYVWLGKIFWISLKAMVSLQRIVQLSDAFRQVCSAEQVQIFALQMFYTDNRWSCCKYSFPFIVSYPMRVGFVYVIDENSSDSANKHAFWTLTWPAHLVMKQQIFDLSPRRTADGRPLWNRSKWCNTTPCRWHRYHFHVLYKKHCLY